MTIEEISVKFTADTNALKKALSDITETLKGTEAQTMDIASALDEITQPIKDMAKDLRTLTEQSAAYNKQMSEVTKTVGGTGKAVAETASRTQETSKQSVAETAKMVQGWQKVKDKMLEISNTRPKISRAYSNPVNDMVSADSTSNTEQELEAEQARLEALQRDYTTLSNVMSELNINKSVSSEMSRLKTLINENKAECNELYNAMEKLKSSPTEGMFIGDKMVTAGTAQLRIEQLDKSSEQAWGKLEKLETAMEGVSAENRKFGSPKGLERMNAAINEAQANVTRLGTALKNSQQDTTSTGFFGRLASTVKNVGNATASLIHRFQNGVSHIRNFGTAAGNAGRRLFSLYENTTLIGRGLSSLKDKLSGLSSKFAQTSRMVKSMVLSMLFMQLMSGMGETLQSFAKQSAVVNNDLSLLASSFTYLKSSILSAFQPLLSYITPILTSIVNTVADAFNKLAEFFAYLTGQTTFEKAVYTQKDYSASLDQSAASAKELQSVLLGFDQITKLDDNSGSSGSGGSGNGLNTGNWETTKVDISSSLADSIKSGNWEAVGKALGDKINSALGSIDWSSVQKKCNSIAEKIADFLNGAVEETDWNLVGSTLGNGINTILGAINTFQKKFDFKKWGESLAETLNSTLSTTDWSLAGDTLGTAVQNVIDTGFGFVKTFDWKKAGESASKTVNNFFGAIDFKEGGKTFGEGVKGVLNSISTFFDEVDWDSIGTDLVDAITSVDWIGIITGAIKAVISVAGAFYKLVLAIWDAIINQIKSTDWSDQAQKIWEGIKEVWSKLKDTALEVGLKLKNTLSDIWESIKSLWGNSDDKSLPIAAKLSAALDEETVGKIKDWATDKLQDWKDKTAILTATVATAPAAIRQWWKDRADQWKDKISKFSVNSVTTIQNIKTWWNNRSAQWKNKISKFSVNSVTTIQSIKTWWNNRSAQWKNKTVRFTIVAATSAQALKNGFRSAINTVIGWINSYIIDNLNKLSWKIDPIRYYDIIHGKYKTLFDGTTIGFNVGHISTFATGGFPEDGLFMANHGELVGKFSNGKTAVANNAQIVEGIEAGVYRAVTAANSSGGKSGGSTPVIKVYVGGKEVTDVVIKDINDRTIQTGKNPILV